MDSHALRAPNGRGFGTTDDLREDSHIAETRAERVRLARVVLSDLEGELQRLEHDYNDALEQLADLRWKLAKAEHESAKLREALRSSPVNPVDYEEAQKEIELLRREVELYRYNWSLIHEEAEQRPRWRFWRR